MLSLLEAAQDILEREREQQLKGQLTMQAEIRSVTVLHQKHLLVLFTLYSTPTSVVEPFHFGPAPAPASQDSGSGQLRLQL